MSAVKTFFNQYKSFIFLYLINFSVLFIGLFSLEKYENLNTLLYFFILSTFFLIVFLIYKYLQDKRLLNWLNSNLSEFNEYIEESSSYSKEVARKVKEINKMYLDKHQIAVKNYNQYLQFINRWVHNLKTPLSVLSLIYKSNEENEIIPDIQRETDKILNGLNTALYYARSEEFVNDLHFTKGNLNELVVEVVNDLRRWFIRAEVYPKVEISNDVEILTDVKWFKFVVYQLLSNSIKYADKENASIEIKFENKSLIFSDNGMGIPVKDQKRVFEQFYTGDNGRIKGESTGIGLFLVAEICSKLNYPLQLESREGIGTKITIKVF